MMIEKKRESSKDHVSNKKIDSNDLRDEEKTGKSEYK